MGETGQLDLKILILLPYYNRPIMVRNALTSIAEANEYHSNWHLAFIDDGSSLRGRPVVEEILHEHLDKVTFYYTGEDPNRLGYHMNVAVRDCPADICIMLCDDDALVPDYLYHLNKFFSDNPKINSSYAKVILFDPAWEDYHEAFLKRSALNKHDQPICPAKQKDASQVAWRAILHNQGLVFPNDRTRKLDAYFYKNLRIASRDKTHPIRVYGQYKGIHSKMLGNLDMETARNSTIDIPESRAATKIEHVIRIIRRCIQARLNDIATRICKEAVKTFPDDESLQAQLRILLRSLPETDQE